MAELKTETLIGIDILRVGKGFEGTGCPAGGCEFTADDLDGIVDAYWATKEARTPPVKLGHDENQAILQADGHPAAGWVANLRRLGDRLYADLVDVPAKLAEVIKAGAYRYVSVELEQDMEVDGQKYPSILTGLALLGADLPAVDGLGGLSKLYQKLQLSLNGQTRAVAFEREALAMDGMAEMMDSMDEHMSGMRSTMDKMREMMSGRMSRRRFAEWDTAYVNELPDSAFAYVKPGDKDENGRTAPRTNRYLPHHNADGGVDLPHLRNALARAPQTTLGPDARAQAIRHLQSHARREGVGERQGG